MSNLDSLLLAAQLLSANHAAGNQLINAALYYGPGVLATGVAVGAVRTIRWTLGRYHRWADDRAERRRQAAVTHRLNTVAENTDRIIRDAGQHLADQLLRQIYDTREGEK